MANLPKSHVSVHLGIAAATNLVDVTGVGLLGNLGLQSSAGAPNSLTVDERLHRRLAADGSRQLARLLNRGSAHSVGNCGLSHLDAMAGFECIVDASKLSPRCGVARSSAVVGASHRTWTSSLLFPLPGRYLSADLELQQLIAALDRQLPQPLAILDDAFERGDVTDSVPTDLDDNVTRLEA